MPRKRYKSDEKWNAQRRKQPTRTKAAPAPAPDYGAFTRARGSAKPAERGAAVPALAELAAEEATDLADVGGGVCKCGKPHGDADKHCQHCGRALRRACKGGHPLRDDQQFCGDCGAAAAADEPPPSSSLVPATGTNSPTAAAPPPPPAAQRWEAADMFWVGACVEGALVHLDAEADEETGMCLDEKETERINERAAAVFNKHFAYGGKWKEEINLGMAIAGALFPAMWIRYVIIPREQRAKERATEKKTEKVSTEKAS